MPRAKAASTHPGTQLASLDLNLLVALDALFRDANVTVAGRRIGLSQPAMSHALARLRDLLGDALLLRDGKVMRLTSFAERMAPRVRDLIGAIEATLLAHRSFEPRSATRTFRIATNDYCGAVLMPEVLAQIRRLAPGVVLELYAHRGPAPVEELARGELDLAVGTFLETEASLQRQVLYEERFRCLIRKGHPLVRGAVSLEQFVALEHVLVTAPDYGPGVVDFELAKLGMRRRVAARIPHFLVAPALVAQTELIVTLPGRLAEVAAKDARLRIVEPPLALPAFTVQMTWHGEASDDAASSWLRGVLSAAVAPVARRARSMH
jgi:DNA-binding transcriptional LysR family regulator